MIRKILIVLIVLLIIAQFFRPEKNQSNDNTYHISTKYALPANVEQVLKDGCYDCHSNYTEYPWYSQVQPVAAWMNNHVKEGKSELNFSNFTQRKIAGQNHKFEEIIETVKEHEMPLSSYTWLGMHPKAKLSDEQRQTLVNWAQAQMDMLKAQYPADSLVIKRPPPTPAK
ncbi:heme-binding domain-containing protein [Pollutibacter soli]|uniref:heme-binding domain-containing protein n=1 Tax=Pollutibacter soli TaxID=3034157 RepID=UPI003013E574